MRWAPPALLSAAATDAGGDPHLQKGIHLRVLLSTGLGLPVAPLLVDRVSLGSPDRLEPDSGVLWTDRDGAPLSLPIDLGRVGVAYGWFAAIPNDPVVWAQVLIDKPDQHRPPLPRPPMRPPVALPGRLPGLPLKSLPAGLHASLAEDVRVQLPGLSNVLRTRVDALVSGQVGDSVAASAMAAPYQVSAIGMDRVRVTGSGVIRGARVVRLSRPVRSSKFEGWRQLALPVRDGRRYRGIDDALDVAVARVIDGAPQRFGLHDVPHASDPTSCPPATSDDEKDRVSALWDGRLERLLDMVLNDLSAGPAHLLLDPEAMQGTRSSVAAMRQPPLAGLLQSALDPGVGRLLGLVDRDDHPPAAAGELVVYLVRGGFLLHRDDLGRSRLALLLPSVADPNAFPLPLPDVAYDGSDGPFVDLLTAAAAVVDVPSSAPQRPAIDSMEDVAWLPAEPPLARRHIAVGLGDLGPGAGLALARDTPFVVGLNSRLPELLPDAPDRALPIMCGILREQAGAPAATAAGQGEVSDRGADADPTEYRVAQIDWFGRWSPWSYATVGAGVRPPVPVPVIQASWVPPATAGDPGRLVVSAVQPRDPDLAPGGYPIDRLRVTADVGAGATSADVPAERGGVAVGSDPVPLRAEITVPGLAAAEARKLAVSAVWIEQPIGAATPRSSASSPTQSVYARDPRPPAALTLPNTLTYGSRPDTLGLSRMRFSWPAAAAPVAYRVYHSDETTLSRRLETLSGGAADAFRASLAPVDGARPAAPDRAAAFRAAAGLFGRDCFELLTRTPLTTPVAGPLTFEHEVSGSLDVLVFYRVVPLSGQYAEAPFTDCTLLIRGVPNGRPPAQPLLTVAAREGAPGTVDLTVVVPRGATGPAALRLRRSRISGADPLGMPVVAHVAAPGWSVDHASGTWSVRVSDTGALPGIADAALAAWTTYTWRVEVQGPPEPGTFGADALPTAWSLPSAPASLLVVPPTVAGLVAGAATVTGTGVDVTFGTTTPLTGPPGTYQVEVYRRSNGSADLITSADLLTLRQPDGTYLARDTTVAASGTSYLVAVRDRLGRRSAPATVATVS